MVLDAAAVAALLPHRGEMQLLSQVTVFAHNHFKGTACWTDDSAVLQGHFPGMPLVPGVLLIEAVAQVAGAGMLAGDRCARSMGNDFIGVLAAVRKCSFKRPVLPHEPVDIEVHCRQMTSTAVNVTATVQVAQQEAAIVEILIINTLRADIEKHLATLQKAPL